MNQIPASHQDLNQPQIQTETIDHSNKSNNQNQRNSIDDKSEQSQREEELKHTQQMMKNIRNKHPECIPVFYVKHEASSKQFPSPKTPFILFKKDLLIEQAMYNLYNQIQIKGLYFFCTRFDPKQKKMKYVILKPGQTIEQVLIFQIQIYKKYGRNDHLTLIYGDKTIGMGGVNKMQKWLIRIMVFILTIWLLIMAYPLYISYSHGGMPAVWDTVSLIWKRYQHGQKTKTNPLSQTLIPSVSDENNDPQDRTLYESSDGNFSQKWQSDRQKIWNSDQIHIGETEDLTL